MASEPNATRVLVRGPTGYLVTSKDTLAANSKLASTLNPLNPIPFEKLAATKEEAIAAFNALKAAPDSTYYGDNLKSKDSTYPPITPHECLVLMLDLMNAASSDASVCGMADRAEKSFLDKIAYYREINDEHSVRFLEECLTFARGYSGRAGAEYFNGKAVIADAEKEANNKLSENKTKETDEINSAVKMIQDELVRIKDFTDFSKMKSWLTSVFAPLGITTAVIGIVNKYALSIVTSARPLTVVIGAAISLVAGGAVYGGFRYTFSKITSGLEEKISKKKTEVADRWGKINNALLKDLKTLKEQRQTEIDERIFELRGACAKLLWDAAMRYFPEYVKSQLIFIEPAEGKPAPTYDLAKPADLKQAVLDLTDLSVDFVAETSAIATAGNGSS